VSRRLEGVELERTDAYSRLEALGVQFEEGTREALARAQRDITNEGGRIVAIMPDRQNFAAQFKREANSTSLPPGTLYTVSSRSSM
jgi:hypothetical protein